MQCFKRLDVADSFVQPVQPNWYVSSRAQLVQA